ncbi:hypothetical protein [uncultured Bacteroides sp.]|uniref:hypothetical protein n=1 Tax=uncultured Bacteroides sp. TaxID=162156 RepID=UPI00261B100B|nr:hypothetical protein [uncultured Bacteroides sp.]
MKLRIIVTSMALAAFSFCANAQNSDTPKENPWFVQGELGVTYSTGGTGIGRLLSPGGSIAVGKYFVRRACSAGLSPSTSARPR